jgi:hypothetical protein
MCLNVVVRVGLRVISELGTQHVTEMARDQVSAPFLGIAHGCPATHPDKDVSQIPTSHTTFLTKGLLSLLKTPRWSLLQLVQTAQSGTPRQRKVGHPRRSSYGQ